MAADMRDVRRSFIWMVGGNVRYKPGNNPMRSGKLEGL
jgi:hypothetical protein